MHGKTANFNFVCHVINVSYKAVRLHSIHPVVPLYEDLKCE